ncbi:MAG TPA: PHP domain-containing protein [Acidimicrobiia bacterium]|nr:PHP domain-containing protein [Acidimicrobiia bacterium]
MDLHTHSTSSDGSDPPEVVVEKAVAAGLTAMALTDHDTLEGVARARARAGELGLDLISGVELSVEWEPGAMHLVVLFLEPGTGPLRDLLGGLQGGRDERNLAIVTRLRDLGLMIEYDEVVAEAGGGSVGRPHIGAVLVRHGYVPDLATAFDLYLAKGRSAYIDRRRLHPEEALSLARQEGAAAVLAHPHTLGLNSSGEVRTTLRRLKEAGLTAMECYYPLYSPLEREGYVALARSYGLVPSGGSDYHGLYKPGIELGRGRGDLVVPDSVLAELRSS